MKKLMSVEWAHKHAALAPFVLRLVLGLSILLHGWQKLTDMGIDNVGAMFTQWGVPAPMFSAGLVTWVEIIGGVCLILGIMTRLSAKLLSIVMIVAIFTAHLGNGFFVGNGGVELALVYLGGFVAIMLMGPGKWSIESK